MRRFSILALAVFCIAIAGCGGGGIIIPGLQNQLPNARLTADVTSGNAPLTVSFSAATSSDPDGTIASAAWDLDGNGSFETSTGTTLTAQQTYNTAGNVTVRVRITDDDGGSSTAQLVITVTSPGGGGGGGGVFDGTFVVPPVETFADQSSPGDSDALFWRKNFYHVLPAAFDADRVYQNLSLSTWADEIVRLTNIERANNGGLPPLVRDNHLEMVMQAHCRDLALRDYFQHETLENLSPFDRLDTMDPPFYSSAGENIAAGQQSPQEVVTGWMNSPGHRANILNASFQRIGVGVYHDAGSGPFDFYYGQFFATFGSDPDAHDWIEISEAP